MNNAESKDYCFKTIFAKPGHLKFNNDRVNEVLSIEIDHHLRKWPDMAFEKLENSTPERNEDKSLTFKMLFITMDEAKSRGYITDKDGHFIPDPALTETISLDSVDPS